MTRVLFCLCVLVISIAGPLRADETIRQVQEELRKRNLYFGNVDGQTSPELAGALRRYQTRKGFSVTGSLNDETASSLRIQTTVASAKTLPDVPVLRSDTASALPEEQRVALQKAAEENLDAPTPPPPAESPGPGQNLTPEQVTKFVTDYLRDAETDDVAIQVKCFAFPVDYFTHGSQTEAFVSRDVRNYLKDWPERRYTLLGPVNFFASGKEGETNIEFTIEFNVRNPGRKTKYTASGRTKNFWTIRSEGDELKIVAIREQRVRE